MANPSRRTFLISGLIGSNVLLAACGNDEDFTEGNAATANSPVAATPLPAPAPVAPTPSPTPSPAPAPPSVAVAPTEWIVGLPLAFAAGVDTTVDLARTLPASVPRGGVFSVEPTGASLPSGASLAPSGILSISSASAVSITAGIVFAYNAP